MEYLQDQLDKVTILSDCEKDFQYTIQLQARGENRTIGTNHINLTADQFWAIRKALLDGKI
jgi:hypothetical protein